MHITLETDYAVRIVDCLARADGRMGAKAISEKACVTLRFSLKILRKLVASGIVRSYKGAQGGYEIARPLDQISVNDILETIEGPFTLNRCQFRDYQCTRTGDKHCAYHYLFAQISEQVKERLDEVTISHIVDDEYLEKMRVESIANEALEENLKDLKNVD